MDASNPMIAAALGSQVSDNPLLMSLLAGSEGTGATPTLPSMEDLIHQLESTNPTAGLIAKFLVARQEAQPAEEAEEDIGSEDQLQLTELSERFNRLTQRLESLHSVRSEVSQLRRVNDALAAALGACYVCWGEDPDCEVCLGRGCPGSAFPDVQLFGQWVAPALRLLSPPKEVHGTVRNLEKHTAFHNSYQPKGEKHE